MQRQCSRAHVDYEWTEFTELIGQLLVLLLPDGREEADLPVRADRGQGERDWRLEVLDPNLVGLVNDEERCP